MIIEFIYIPMTNGFFFITRLIGYIISIIFLYIWIEIYFNEEKKNNTRKSNEQKKRNTPNQ